MHLLGQHFFEAAADTQVDYGPIVIRPDSIKDARKARQYMSTMLGMLRALEMSTAVGRALLSWIRLYRKPVLIIPNDGIMRRGSYVETFGMFNATVNFTPTARGRGACCSLDKQGQYTAAESPHEQLIHELTHVARIVSGTLGKMKHGIDDEEELAVMVTNIFSVEIKRNPISDYFVSQEITKDFATFSTGYYNDYFDVIDCFARQNVFLAVKLARVKTTYNPLLTYMQNHRPPQWSGP